MIQRFSRLLCLQSSLQRHLVLTRSMETFQIVKSRSDQRAYRGLVLENKMKVMLISDPTTDKSAASMDVHVGSMRDPREFPGLAHFLEHMVFMGSSKYPNENEYNRYLSSHNGMSNAYTDSDHTNYYFDVSPEYLAGALDIFGQFFIDPLFTESATDREIQAVDSENQKNIQNDSWRLLLLEQAWSSTDHDYNKFSCGNLKTLQKPGLREQLLKVQEVNIKFEKTHSSLPDFSFTRLGIRLTSWHWPSLARNLWMSCRRW